MTTSPLEQSDTAGTSAPPSRDDHRTTMAGRSSGGALSRSAGCLVCTQPFSPTGRQRYCSTACRKTAFRRRTAAAPPPIVVPARTPRRDRTVYECNSCGTRRLGQQRCDDCGTFGRSFGLGGSCPCCDEPVTLTDLDLST